MTPTNEVAPQLTPSRTIILDACTVINLHASRQMESVIRNITGHVMIAESVFVECRLDPFAPDDEIVERIDLLNLIEAGDLTVVVSVSDSELQLFSQFLMKLDDGEAMTLALAVHRGWTVVTDDRAAIRELGGHAPLLSTLDVMKMWAETTGASADVIRTSLADLQVRGRYTPSKTHPLRWWWELNLRIP